ncbi:MAG: NAD(P)H-binding protein [Gammaproteobacteria bacterium]
MTTLVLGASGATGRLLVEQLLQRDQHVRIIVRAPDKLPAGIKDHPNVSITHASVLELSDAEMARLVDGYVTR